MPTVIIKEKVSCGEQGYTRCSNLNQYRLIRIFATVVFAVASVCNCVTYLMRKKVDSSVSCSYNFRCYQAFVTAVYGYGCIFPFGLYLLVKYIGSKVDLIQFFSMWKYSLFIFIPSCLLLVIPMGILRWTITLTAGIASVAFVGLNLKSRVLAVVFVVAYVLQFALAMFIKSWFFRIQR